MTATYRADPRRPPRSPPPPRVARTRPDRGHGTRRARPLERPGDDGSHRARRRRPARSRGAGSPRRPVIDLVPGYKKLLGRHRRGALSPLPRGAVAPEARRSLAARLDPAELVAFDLARDVVRYQSSGRGLPPGHRRHERSRACWPTRSGSARPSRPASCSRSTCCAAWCGACSCWCRPRCGAVARRDVPEVRPRLRVSHGADGAGADFLITTLGHGAEPCATAARSSGRATTW